MTRQADRAAGAARTFRTLLGCAALLLGALGAPQPAAAGTVTCESHHGNRGYCPANTSGGVHVRTQLSRASCHRGTSWGYDRRGIWVANGCRAVFSTGRDGYDNSHHSHSGDDKGAAVAAGIALLAIGAMAAAAAHDDHKKSDDGRWRHDYQRNRDHGHGWNGGDRGGRKVTCESHQNRYQYCPARVHRNRVRLERRFSSSGCEFHRDWGFDARGIWVDNGCRARFSIQ